MPDILLIQPPIRDFYLTAKRTMPYGLACIAASLRHDGFSVEILDGLATDKSRNLAWPSRLDCLKPFYGREDRSPFALFHRFRHFGYSIEHLTRSAKAARPKLIGISCLFTAYSHSALELAAAVKQALPAVPVVFGGHHPTALPEAVMRHPQVDFILRGDGEAGMPKLAAALRDGRDPENIPGLVRRRPGGGLAISPPARTADLNQSPLPAHDLMDRPYYCRGGRRTVTISATRGCPLHCSYCAVNAQTYHGFRRRSVASVMAELEAARAAQPPVGFIDFEDEHLSADRAWFQELLQAIRQRFEGDAPELRAMNGLYAPSLDARTLALMRAAGFRTLNLALITTAPDQLKRFARANISAEVDRVLEEARLLGLDAVAYLIVAGPRQDPMSSVTDLLFLACRRVLAGVSVFYPAPGSRDYDWCDRNGLLPDDAGLMRATALPVEHLTDRTQAVTLLRLGRLLNFMKHLIDEGLGLPPPAPLRDRLLPAGDRPRIGRKLLAAFLHDGRLRGVDETGVVYEHCADPDLTRAFLQGLREITVRGARS